MRAMSEMVDLQQEDQTQDRVRHHDRYQDPRYRQKSVDGIMSVSTRADLSSGHGKHREVMAPKSHESIKVSDDMQVGRRAH